MKSETVKFWELELNSVTQFILWNHWTFFKVYRMNSTVAGSFILKRLQVSTTGGHVLVCCCLAWMVLSMWSIRLRQEKEKEEELLLFSSPSGGFLFFFQSHCDTLGSLGFQRDKEVVTSLMTLNSVWLVPGYLKQHALLKPSPLTDWLTSTWNAFITARAPVDRLILVLFETIHWTTG